MNQGQDPRSPNVSEMREHKVRSPGHGQKTQGPGADGGKGGGEASGRWVPAQWAPESNSERDTPSVLLRLALWSSLTSYSPCFFNERR